MGESEQNLSEPRENEMRVSERDGKRWLQQWRAPLGGQEADRVWVDIAELASPAPKFRDVLP